MNTTNTAKAPELDENVRWENLNKDQKYKLMTILSYQVTSMAVNYEVATAKQLKNHLGSELTREDVINVFEQNPETLWNYFLDHLSPNQKKFYEENIYWFLTYNSHLVPEQIRNMKTAAENHYLKQKLAAKGK